MKNPAPMLDFQLAPPGFYGTMVVEAPEHQKKTSREYTKAIRETGSLRPTLVELAVGNFPPFAYCDMKHLYTLIGLKKAKML